MNLGFEVERALGGANTKPQWNDVLICRLCLKFGNEGLEGWTGFPSNQPVSECHEVQASAPVNGLTELVLWLFLKRRRHLSSVGPLTKIEATAYTVRWHNSFSRSLKAKVPFDTRLLCPSRVWGGGMSLMRLVLIWGFWRASLFCQRGGAASGQAHQTPLQNNRQTEASRTDERACLPYLDSRWQFFL